MDKQGKRELENRVEQYCFRRQLLQNGDRVLVGLSGGADSVCLLMLLLALRNRFGLTIRAAHVHHGLRETADRDEQYVKSLCADRNVPLEIVHIDAAALAQNYHTGIEEAGHIARKMIFEEICRKWEARDNLTNGSCRIALAHHKEDSAETLLFNLCRGAGIAGACGIRPSSGRIIRPLLETGRNEIEDYLQTAKIGWCVDETNADTEYARNFIRNRIIPMMKENINSGACDHLAGFAEEALQLDRYLTGQTGKAVERVQDQAGRIIISRLAEEEPLIRKRIIYQWITDKAGQKKDILSTHVEAVLRLCGLSDDTAAVRKEEMTSRRGSGQTDLPYRLTAVREYDILQILGPKEKKAEDVTFAIPDRPECYEIRVFDFDGCMESIPRNQYTKWFDYDKITAFPGFRTREPQDRLTLDKSGHSKSVQRIMIDAKIPADIRDKIILPTAGREVLWVPGVRISAAYPVDKDTKKVLELSLPAEPQMEVKNGRESC